MILSSWWDIFSQDVSFHVNEHIHDIKQLVWTSREKQACAVFSIYHNSHTGVSPAGIEASLPSWLQGVLPL